MARKMKTMDGNQAAAHVAYAYTEVATIYPITPSSVMPEHVDEVGNRGEEKISLDRLSRLLRCSQRPELQVQYTDPWQQAPLPLHLQLHRVCS